MIINLPNHNTGAFERRVRDRMDQECVDHAPYLYLWCQPYPRILGMRDWLINILGEPGVDWQEWHGWLLFKHESDVLIMNMVWSFNESDIKSYDFV